MGPFQAVLVAIKKMEQRVRVLWPIPGTHSLPTTKNKQTITGYDHHHLMIALPPEVTLIRQY
jgi:hypothetical protein